MKHIVSFSGGKDSTAMLLRLLEEGRQVDDILFFDTGWEFPEMLIHVNQVEKYIGRQITRLHPREPFTYWMLRRPIVANRGPNKGKVHRIGYGWPLPQRRWCTSLKVQTINRYSEDSVQYIGIAADEIKRAKIANTKRKMFAYPLIEWGMTEADCLRYCYDQGFHWNGLYTHFTRASCFCCPLQKIGDLRTLRKHYPHLWKIMLKWDAYITEHNKHNRGFMKYNTVHDMEERFLREELEMAQSFASATN